MQDDDRRRDLINRLTHIRADVDREGAGFEMAADEFEAGRFRLADGRPANVVALRAEAARCRALAAAVDAAIYIACLAY